LSEEFLWVEKYRPQTINDCILPQSLKQTFLKIVETKELPNMLFSGTAGLGKTTVARALCNELELDYIVVNASEEGNIDTLRGKIKSFASSVSLMSKYKVIILDEADYLNPQSTQPALRGFIEEFSNNCRFILTCNFKNRIIEPLHSRCSVYEFNTTKKDMIGLCDQFLKRCVHILEREGFGVAETQRENIANLIVRYAPDWRRILNELQRFTIGGFSEQVQVSATYDSLYQALSKKDFKKVRKWVAENSDADPSVVFRNIYDNMYEKIEPHHIPQTVIILADYQYKNAFVADHELNTVACLTELMSEIDFK